MRTENVLSEIRSALHVIGYSDDLLHDRYAFPNASGNLEEIDLAAFAQNPPDYRNACIGVAKANGKSGGALVNRFKELGAPIVLEIGTRSVNAWSIRATGAVRIQSIALDGVAALINGKGSSWGPRTILEAKNTPGTLQLDFIDIGLMPLLEGMMRTKLERLLRSVVVAINQAYINQFQADPNLTEVFRLVFRFIAAKVLLDRGQPGAWESSDPLTVLSAVEDYYSEDAHHLPACQIREPTVLQAAWESLTSSFHFQNLSVDDLAFVYENTFISDESRKAYSTHSTPPNVAEYMVRKLPLQGLPVDRRRVLDVCSGGGNFLVAAMRRLREFLPTDMSEAARHQYLKAMLVGIELDPFAHEVSRLCLMLADYPNPNGWLIEQADVFAPDALTHLVPSGGAVLCNPPFGPFLDADFATYKGSIQALDKQIEVLRRVLQGQPAMLGYVVPAAFLDGTGYREVRDKLVHNFGSIELVRLPDKVFAKADQETVLILAWDRQDSNQARIICRRVTELDYPDFRDYNVEPPGMESVRTAQEARDGHLWVDLFAELWDLVDQNPTLQTLVEVRRGLQFLPGELSKGGVIQQPTQGYKPCYATPRNTLFQYGLADPGYLEVRDDRFVGHPLEYPWHEPKTVVNSRARSRGIWRLAAATETSGALVLQGFHAVFPRASSVRPEVVTALLNGPLANAWVYGIEGKRDVRKSTLDNFPIPLPDAIDQDLIASLVHQAEDISATDAVDRAGELRELMLMIDLALIEAYKLPVGLQSRLFQFYAAQSRPARFPFHITSEAMSAARERLQQEAGEFTDRKQYHALIDKSFLLGLDDREASELATLQSRLEAALAPLDQRGT